MADEKKKTGRGEEEQEEETWVDLCSAILSGHPNLLENFFTAGVQPGPPSKVVESLKYRELLKSKRRLARTKKYRKKNIFGTKKDQECISMASITALG